MIKSANQYQVHVLFSHEGNVHYPIPPYQREYSWNKWQWEELFDDLLEADGAHFLGTIITLDQTVDTLQSTVLQVIDGQQRLTTLTLLLAAVHGILRDRRDELDDDQRTDLINLSRQLVRKPDGKPRITPQTQGHNADDYRRVLEQAGLPIKGEHRPYFSARKISKCYRFFVAAIHELAEEKSVSVTEAALQTLEAAQRAVLVKIEVASHADAFVLFESLNNRGMPLSPLDLIKNHLLAESEKAKVMSAEEAFEVWNAMLASLGDNYATQERFLRHYYNAFKSELPAVSRASVATKSNLIRIYETLLRDDLSKNVARLADAARIYGRINGVVDSDAFTAVDAAFQKLQRAQGAPSYVLLLWLLSKQEEFALSDAVIAAIADNLTSFFVRRNLTGIPQTYALTALFMSLISDLDAGRDGNPADVIRARLQRVSVDDAEFRTRLLGPVYEDNTDVTRFLLTTLAEDRMTKESFVDLWRKESDHFVWTIEHILPQGENLPAAWLEMLGNASAAKDIHATEKHRLGNLTITAYNSNLGNKSFTEKRDRTDAKGLPIGYRNGLHMNATLATKDSWTAADIDARTESLADEVISRFPL